MQHTLKTLPAYYEAVAAGDKNFEIRNNHDRGFQKGDTVLLKEFFPDRRPMGVYSDRKIVALITYVTNYEQKPGFVVFGLSVFTP